MVCYGSCTFHYYIGTIKVSRQQKVYIAIYTPKNPLHISINRIIEFFTKKSNFCRELNIQKKKSV